MTPIEKGFLEIKQILAESDKKFDNFVARVDFKFQEIDMILNTTWEKIKQMDKKLGEIDMSMGEMDKKLDYALARNDNHDIRIKALEDLNNNVVKLLNNHEERIIKEELRFYVNDKGVAKYKVKYKSPEEKIISDNKD